MGVAPVGSHLALLIWLFEGAGRGLSFRFRLRLWMAFALLFLIELLPAQVAQAPNFTRRILPSPDPMKPAYTPSFSQETSVLNGFDGQFTVFSQASSTSGSVRQVWRASRDPGGFLTFILCSVVDGTSNQAPQSCTKPWISSNGNVIVFQTNPSWPLPTPTSTRWTSMRVFSMTARGTPTRYL